ncbi:hypothetical protein TRVA0_007S01398 [Trichomonascus vanleenenianus]|uniref:uncharacterized protein n=1 Tax=Trichomonascus vanleenenianus TaxID=2268995 RepID=UPI003EC95B45
MTIGEIGNFMAYGFAPASIVSPLGVFALISNCFVAPIFFKENIRGSNIAGVAVAIGGVLCMIASSSHTSISHDPFKVVDEVLTQKSTGIYCICSVIAAAMLVRFSQEFSEEDHLAGLFSNLGLVALFGAHTAMATKCLSGILSLAFLRAFSHAVTYFLVAYIVATAVLQVVFLNRALHCFDATLVVPVHFVFFTLSVIIASAIIFHDFDNRTPFEALVFMVGCILTFCGVGIIALSKRSAVELEEGDSSTVTSEESDEEPETLATDASSAERGALLRRQSLTISSGSLPLTHSGVLVGSVLHSQHSRELLSNRRYSEAAPQTHRPILSSRKSGNFS